ncbi:MOSC domain-containing protein [Sulfurimonas sp.]|nr:MOSC domain-containing protein [Sulfurimonas sp.]
MAKTKVGQVLKLFTSKSGTSERFNENLISLDESGVLNDKFYNKDIERSVLISSIDSYNLIKKYNIEMPLGYLGENILLDYNPYSLEVGSRIQIADTVLEISQYCTICNHLAVLDVKLPTLLKNDRGIFAKVISGGDIKIKEDVYTI